MNLDDGLLNGAEVLVVDDDPSSVFLLDSKREAKPTYSYINFQSGTITENKMQLTGNGSGSGSRRETATERGLR